jgi:hypothetical protein
MFYCHYTDHIVRRLKANKFKLATKQHNDIKLHDSCKRLKCVTISRL